jgi:hypothetical protein
MATIKDVRVKVRLNVLSVLLKDKGEADQRPGRHGAQRKTIIDCQEVEIPTGELAIRLANAQLVLEDGYMVNTDITPPVVVTDDATGITPVAAIFRGHVNPNGLSTAVRFEYSLHHPNCDGWVTCDETPLTGVTNQSVHKDMAGLTPNTKYYYRVRGYNAAKIAYGIVKSFYTLPTP